jgi:hypothetical protein
LPTRAASGTVLIQANPGVMSVVRLTDDELALVLDVCRRLPVEERNSFLRLLAGELGSIASSAARSVRRSKSISVSRSAAHNSSRTI